MSDVWRYQIPGTDLEVNWNLIGNDLVVRVNKGPTQITRVILRDAAKAMTALSGLSDKGLSGQLEGTHGFSRSGRSSAGAAVMKASRAGLHHRGASKVSPVPSMCTTHGQLPFERVYCTFNSCRS
jgi:hypothetical protein